MKTDQKILEVKEVHKSFDENYIHRGISFDLYKGETLGLLGNSGSGKSVLLRSLIGLEQIQQGSIFFHEKRIDQMTEDEYLPLRTKISYSFQYGALFDSISVFENMAYPLYEHTKLSDEEVAQKVYSYLDLIDLKGKGDLMPSELSGGMQKRVGLARSVILGPEIVLYDEPTAGLDPNNTRNILKVMSSFKEQQMSSIFVTHDIPSALEICDRILIIREGKIGFNDTPQKLMDSKDPFLTSFFEHEHLLSKMRN
ncbi:MAG: ATP-binding cassette domain-containing protein [Bacteriovoracaceae bacterium]|nr:ATP-binding cassette domain-containing protein [Bacteriovoracaceae bacterium]